MSFRNSEEIDKNSWHGQNRGLATRNRRSPPSTTNNDEIIVDSATTTTSTTNNNYKNNNDDSLGGVDDDKRPIRNLRKNVNNPVVDKLYENATTNIEMLRNRREVPGCVVNYNSNRQLLIGCKEQNIIEVRPQCNEDGDEGKFNWID